MSASACEGLSSESLGIFWHIGEACASLREVGARRASRAAALQARHLCPSRDLSASGSPRERERELSKAIGDARNARAANSHCARLRDTTGNVKLRPSKLEPAQFKAVIEAEYIGCRAPGLSTLPLVPGWSPVHVPGCGFPWPTGGKKFAWGPVLLSFLTALGRACAGRGLR